MKKKIIISVVALLLVGAVVTLAVLPKGIYFGGASADFTIDLSDRKGIASNVVSNNNIWDMGEAFFDPQINEEYNVFEFVEYVQLMQCSGGTEDRDLFKEPMNFDVLDDYDFEPLIKNCAGILKLGAKPHLKLGGVPLKYTKDYLLDGFGMNVYPPDDYDVYYNYIFALASALVKEFGKEEVLTWRFGVMTEYENWDWFRAKSETPEDTATEFCKLYDYTVEALIDAIGEDVFVGAHSMTVTEGHWDEAEFIKHIAKGKNYANGGTGTRVCFLSASFYDHSPEEYTEGYTLPETIDYIRTVAEENGLTDLVYGVDEGRLLVGLESGKDSDELLSRTVGYTYQAAYDARLWKQCLDNNIDYFSSWGFLTGGMVSGYPTISYHVAKNISQFAGMTKVSVTSSQKPTRFGVEMNGVSVFDEETKTLRIMAYNFKNDLEYSEEANFTFNVDLSEYGFTSADVKTTFVDDSCNFFDEWQKDRVEHNITNDAFGWSPDDPCLDSEITLKDPEVVELYKTQLRDKYIDCAKSNSVNSTETVKDGVLTISNIVAGNSVVFYEITFK
ncbi:MAG: hypothetical protein IIX14_00935 [Clostridia bacterium]|nr:hypothetical protein [Clostridia bacterium]